MSDDIAINRAELPGAKRFGNFATLGQRFGSADEPDFALTGALHNPSISVRKSCAALKVASSIINAVVVYPGAESGADDIAAATKELVSRAAAITDSASGLLRLTKDNPNYSGYRNVLRQQAAELVAAQWRMAHATIARSLSVDQITQMMEWVLSSFDLDSDGEMPANPAVVDATIAKRLALFGVVPDIHEAVNAFDYFKSEPQALVVKGVGIVMTAAEAGVKRLIGSQSSDDDIAMLSQSLIGKAGSLYAANYRANAMRDVASLRAMDRAERQRVVYCAQLGGEGLSTAHIDQSFQVFMDRMLDMVCEVVPQIKIEHESTQVSPSVVAPAAVRIRLGKEDVQPD